MKRSIRIAGTLAVITGVVGAATLAAAADEAKLQHGKEVYEYWCTSCHGKGLGLFGPGTLHGTMALALKYKGAEPPVLEDRIDLDPQFVNTVVRHGIQAMPPFRKTEITDAELEDMTAYLTRTAR